MWSKVSLKSKLFPHWLSLLVSSPGHSVGRVKNDAKIAVIFLTYCQSPHESLIAVYNSLCNAPYEAAEATRHIVSHE